MPEITLPWGRDSRRVLLPEHWQLQQTLRPSLPAAPQDWLDHLALSLNQPSSGEALSRLLSACRHGRIVLVVEDITRQSPLPLILDVVMKEIRHAGIADSQIEFFFATGMHPPMTAEQVAQKLGPLAAGIRWRSNPWRNPSAYQFLARHGKVEVAIDRGVATADLRILISAVGPHLQAGFGGGYKMILPGCASLETIRGLHRLGVGRAPRQLVGAGAESNPMRQAIDAGGEFVDRFAGKTFAVQYVLDDEGYPAYLSAGEVLSAQRMMAKRCAVACGAVLAEQADVLIVNAYPLDHDLWQTFKAIANTRWAVRPNGLLLCTTRCLEGLNGVKPPRWPLGPAWTRRLVRALGPGSLYSLLTRTMPRLAGDAAFFIRMALQAIHRNRILLAAPGLCERGQSFPGLEVFATAEEAVAAADASLFGRPQRVTVFPHGGTTFPVLSSGADIARAAKAEGS